MKYLGAIIVLLFLMSVGLALPPAPGAFRVSHAIEIDAPAASVWAVFADTEAYGEWNPYVPELSGELREGAILEMVLVEPPSYDPRPFGAKVFIAEPGRHLAWRASIFGVAIFEHHFELESLADGRSRFHQYEDFRGLLCWLWHFLQSPSSTGSPHTTVATSFRTMNEALRDRVRRSRSEPLEPRTATPT